MKNQNSSTTKNQMITTNSPKWQALKLTLKDQRQIKGGSIIIEEDMVI